MKGRKCFGQQMFGAALSPFAFFGVAFPGSAEAETTYIVTQYSYDPAGRLECTAVRMNPAVFGSLPSSACTLGVQGDAEPDRITKNSYDAAGQLIQVRKAVGTSLETVEATYAYSPNGKQTDVIDANGNYAQFTYDGFDRLKQWLFPSAGLPKDRPTAFNPTSLESAFSTAGPVNGGDYEEYDYDNNGNRTYFRKRDGSTLTYTYDALNRMTSKLVPGRSGLPTTNTRSVYYSYDLQSHQTDARFDNAAGEGVSNAFDALGRQTSTSLIMDNVTRTASFEYDADGNRTRMTYPDGNYVTYSYDGLDRPLAIARSGSSTIASYGYDAAGRRNSFNSGINTGYDYDGIGRLKSLSNTPNSNGSYANTYGFNYNPASQLTSLSKSNNLFVFKGVYNVNRGYEVNGLNQYHTAGAASFDYDPNGNLKSDASTTFIYDIENRLVSADGAHKAQLRYDPLGRLYEIAGATGTTRFFYNGDELIGEYDGGGNLLRRYVHGADLKSDDPIAWYEGSGFDGGSERFLRPDWQGSIALVTDSAGGGVYAANTFDEYGIPGAGNGGRFQYTGQAWIPELGMYYYKARFYSPTLGRFMQTDPIGYKDQINLYAYVNNDPLNKFDFSGERVDLVYHMVASPYIDSARHFSVRITPENQAAVANDPRYRNVDGDGNHYTTLSGFPAPTVSFDHIGTLTKEQNRSTDVGSQEGSLPVATPTGMTEGQFIGKLQSSFDNYKNNTNYDLFPEKGTAGYNSNSFATGLVQAAGGSVPSLPSSPMGTLHAPGFDKPLPPQCFSKDGKSC